MTPAELITQRALVVGAGVTGVSVMQYLARHRIKFDVTDSKLDATESVQEVIGSGTYIPGLEQVDVSQYDVMILSPGIPRAHPMLVAALKAGVHVIGDVELFASVVKGEVVAITGSNGKSTVASMAAHVLSQSGRSVELCGNIGTAVLNVLPEASEATPGVTADAMPPEPIYVLELSSYQLESTHRLAPISATVLNISDDHLDRYDSIEHYALTKRQVFERARCCVVNADDDRAHPSNNNTAPILYFSLSDTSAKFHIKAVGDELALCIDDDCVLLASELCVPGLHNVANALAVMALLHPLGLTHLEIKQGLCSFPGLAHRTELVATRQGVRWYNDSKGTNVDACMKAVLAMSGPVVLIAGGQGKGVDFSPLHDLVVERVKALVLIGEDAPLIRAALEGATELFDASSMLSAVKIADQVAVAGDVVLLSPACASFDMFDNYMARGRVFRESVEQLAA